MKPGGVSMETTEPTQDAAVAEPSSLQENATEQAQSQPEAAANHAAPGASLKANGKKRAGVQSKMQSTTSSGVSGAGSRPGAASHHTMNSVKPSATGLTDKKAKTTTTSKPSAAGAVPKRPVGVTAASSTAKNQTRVPDWRPVGPARTTSASVATVTNGTKPPAVNGAPKKRPATETVNNKDKPKPTATTGRVVTSVSTKTSTSTTARPASAATSKLTRPVTGPSTSRMTSTTSRPASTGATTKTRTTRVATAPSTGRTTAIQPPKTTSAVAKKDVGRPPSATVAKKPQPVAASSATKKPENVKPVPTMRLNSAPKGSTLTKAADAKVLQSKPPQPAKSTPIKKPVVSVRFPSANKSPLGKTPPASPANRPANSSTTNTKCGTKPTQTVPPFSATRKIVSKAVTPTADSLSTASVVTAAASEDVRPPETLEESTVALPQELPVAVFAPEGVSTSGSVQHTSEVEQNTQSNEATPSTPKSPVRTNLPQTSLKEQLEDCAPSLTQDQMSSPAKTLPHMAFPPDLPEETINLAKDKSPSTSAALPAAANAIPLTVPPTNLNEEEDEEEREGSQLVSVSEMSGTTQPTEESRPGSGGPLGASVWRAGGALLSELDSEEVSGSQQGASELSAPGVLEGTESMDDLGDGSLKGAMDMEGASVGSPDFEKVPDIPVNDEDDEEDDSDRVYDMDVGSERMDEPHRPRHDNDVDEEEEDDDVEMVSEGVTESGLESYGNADEDDFAEDERLDNLNRVAQPPPPPPQLPSAPAAQWDQPNPFADPWAEPLQPGQDAEAGAANTWQVDSETPTQTPPQVWSVLASKAEPQNVEVQAPLPVPGTSQSSENLGDGKIPPQVPSPQPDLDCQGLDIHLQERDKESEEEAEPETLPADEVLGGPATAPTSNPSSSETEDEASDTEGEAQLEDSLETQATNNVTFDSQPPAQRCLSIVDEGDEADTEEVEGGVGEDTTPPSAASLTSYGLDSVTTASNSNAQSTGESCIKSPGIFSLEELPEEAKQPQTEQCPAEPQYIDCGKQETDSAEDAKEEVFTSEEALDASSTAEEIPNDGQPPSPYYSICEKTQDSFAGFTAALHPHRRDHSVYARTCYDIIKPHGAVTPPKLTCADLPPRSPGRQALSPQLRRLEQHQRQLLELQQRREQQSKPLEEAEQERKRRVEEEERKKKEEAEEEIKRNKEEEERKRKKEEEELKQRKALELQLQQQQEELKQRQQIMQWQQELQQSNKGQAVLLSPSSGLCTIYEALENSDEEAEDEGNEQHSKNKKPKQHAYQQICDSHEKMGSDDGSPRFPDPLDSTQPSSNPSHDDDVSSFFSPDSPERPPPLDLDWGKKVDIVQQLINQTLLLNGDGCSSLLLLPGGAGGTLSPLESSLWPSLLPPLTPPSATVTSVSSFSPEATGSSPQGEWTVVELETHH